MSSVKSLLFSHNHHLLSVKGCEAGLDVLAFEGDEALSQPFCYRIEFTSADHAISKEMMLMKAASLTLQAPVAQGFGINVQQPVRVIQGVVTGFERLSTSRDETHYALTLQPRLALLNRSHQNAIYQDQSVPQIVEKILRERHGLRGQDFLFSLTKTYPRREQVMQYGEDDLRFITRLLGEVGIWFRFTADTRLHIDVAEFCDSQQGYEKGLTLPSVPPSGQQSAGVDAVWEMACRHRVVEQQVSTRDYNYREATADMNAQVDVTRGETTTFGEAYLRVFQRDGKGLFFLVTQYGDLHFVTRTILSQCSLKVGHGLHGLVIQLQDDIVLLQESIGRTAFGYFYYLYTFGSSQFLLFFSDFIRINFVTHVTTGDAQQSTLYGTILFQIGYHFGHDTYRNSKTVS